jgi:hypothetical protein
MMSPSCVKSLVSRNQPASKQLARPKLISVLASYESTARYYALNIFSGRFGLRSAIARTRLFDQVRVAAYHAVGFDCP